MIICVCHRVSDRDIARAARAGCATFDELQFELSVATACGACHDCARQTFEHHAAQPCQACAAHRGDCRCSLSKPVTVVAGLRVDSVTIAAA